MRFIDRWLGFMTAGFLAADTASKSGTRMRRIRRRGPASPAGTKLARGAAEQMLTKRGRR